MIFTLFLYHFELQCCEGPGQHKNPCPGRPTARARAGYRTHLPDPDRARCWTLAESDILRSRNGRVRLYDSVVFTRVTCRCAGNMSPFTHKKRSYKKASERQRLMKVYSEVKAFVLGLPEYILLPAKIVLLRSWECSGYVSVTRRARKIKITTHQLFHRFPLTDFSR